MRALLPARLATVAVATAVGLAACSDTAAPLTGTWEPDAAAASEAPLGERVTFYADGRVRIVAPDARPDADAPDVFDARYATDGDSLLTLSDAQGSERFRMRLDADTLWLEAPSTGQASRLVRRHAR